MSSELLSNTLVFTAPPALSAYPDINIEPSFEPAFTPQFIIGTGNTGDASQGQAVSMTPDGNIIVGGGSGDDSNNGAVWTFVKTGGIFVQRGDKVSGTGATGEPFQSSSISISSDGSTLASSGTGDNSGTGATWVFINTGGSWIQQGDKLIGTGYSGTSPPFQGRSVSVAGNTLAITSTNNKQDTDDIIGCIWVFNRVTDVWTQTGDKLVTSGYSGSTFMGVSMALSADETTIVTGGQYDNNNVGAAWVFINTGGSWVQQGDKIVGTGYSAPFPGYAIYQGSYTAISADGNTIVSGAIYDNGAIGAAWVFKRNAGVWTQDGKLVASDHSAPAVFLGYSVAISSGGDTVVYGGPNNESNAGGSWMFVRTGGSWVQQGSALIAVQSTNRQGITNSVATDGTFVTSISGSGGGYYYYSKSNPTVLRITSNLEVDGVITGAIDIPGDVSIAGTLTVNNIVVGTMTATVYDTVSDSRLKENITLLNKDESTTAINNINTYQYNYVPSLLSPTIHYGVIAQELEQTGLDELVTDSNGIKSVNYIEMIPLLIGSIQTLLDQRYGPLP